MSYPVLETERAVEWLTAYRAELSETEDAPQAGPPPEGQGSDESVDMVAWRAWAVSLIEMEAQELDRWKTMSLRTSMSKFEADAAARIHTAAVNAFGKDHPAFADHRFWNWLGTSIGYDLVYRRYSSDDGKRFPAVRNFASDNAAHTFFYRLWLRADMSVCYDGDHADYTLTTRGDVDFWQSHILRQRYAEAPDFARALIRFQYPDGQSMARLTGRKQIPIRTLAKELKSSCANNQIELMDEEEATVFIEAIWTRAEPRSKADIQADILEEQRKKADAQ